jgi:hypothetical protein
LVILSTGEGRDRQTDLWVFTSGAEGLVPAPRYRCRFDDLRKVPDELLATDIDNDGLGDVLVFLPGGRDVPIVLRHGEEGFERDPRGSELPGLGVFEGISRAQVSGADVDGDGRSELFVASGNFARSMLIRADGSGGLVPEVIEQFNGPAPDSVITSCAAVDLDGDGQAEVLLLDRRTEEVLVFRRDERGEVILTERLDTGGLGGEGMMIADIDGQGAPELVLVGRSGFGVLFHRSNQPRFREVASYESRLHTAYLHRIAVGDLNGDGQDDIALTEGSRNGIVLLAPSDAAFERALGFRVFEAKTFSQPAETRGEPRELIAAELTGDGRTDLAILVHDKLIIYVQE